MDIMCVFYVSSRHCTFLIMAWILTETGNAEELLPVLCMLSIDRSTTGVCYEGRRRQNKFIRSLRFLFWIILYQSYPLVGNSITRKF